MLAARVLFPRAHTARTTARRALSKAVAMPPRTDRRRGPVREVDDAERAANAAALAQFIDADGGAGALRTGRSWRTSELRLKSYDDLQRLWFVLLKERNILLTERQWCRTNRRHWVNGESNLYKVKRSMARIQGVVGERARAYKARLALTNARSIGREHASVFNAVDAHEDADAPGVHAREHAPTPE